AGSVGPRPSAEPRGTGSRGTDPRPARRSACGIPERPRDERTRPGRKAVNPSYPQSDAPPYTGYLPWHSVDPEGNVVLLASNGDAVPDELGIVWKLSLLQAESLQDADLGALAARIDNLLMNIPDKTPVQ